MFSPRLIFPPVVAGFALLLYGCSSSSDTAETLAPEVQEVTIVAGEVPSEATKQKMLEAKDALFERLSGRLMEAMGTVGPAGAIAVCRDEASKIAAEVGDEHGLQIGRTGVRLRNQANLAPVWAKSLVQARTETPTFAKLDNGQAAALLPIKLQVQCLMCHGPQEGIAPVIQEQLARLYPQDQATGFQEGELRGWFWIESPTQTETSGDL